MPLYDFICDNPACSSNIEKSGIEFLLSYEEYLRKKDGFPCPECESGTIKAAPCVCHYGKSNQPDQLKNMLVQRTRDYDKKHPISETEPSPKASLMTPRGQEIACRKLGIKAK